MVSRFSATQVRSIIDRVLNRPDGEAQVSLEFGIAGPDLSALLRNYGLIRCNYCKQFIGHGEEHNCMPDKQVHTVKVWPQFYKSVESGERSFDIRKDDRGYEVGDNLVLHEYDPEEGFTGASTIKQITWITRFKDIPIEILNSWNMNPCQAGFKKMVVLGLNK